EIDGRHSDGSYDNLIESNTAINCADRPGLGAGTIRECLRSGRMGDIPELIRKGRDLYSMQLFDQHLIDLVNSGLVTMETAIYASSNPEEFERSLRVE
ncbi:MAG TPA: hypothetical protein VLM79_03335, partial [Kofleriaceae bacterium]|nr:hypothetical protein [Kofleriaceae bacterium]